MTKCGNPLCEGLRAMDCSFCHQEGYCSKECQIQDWKIHKLMCMKNDKNSTKLLPINEVTAKVYAIQEKLDARGPDNETVIKRGTEDKRRILTYFISFAEHQYRNKASMKLGFYVRDGIGASTWGVDIDIFFYLNIKLGRNFYNLAEARHEKDILRKAIYHYERALSVLKQWQSQIDLEVIQQIERVGEENRNELFERPSDTGARLSDCFTSLGDNEKAVNYCDIAILNAEKVTIKEIKIELLQHAMMLKGNRLSDQKKYVEAKTVYEECYNLLAETHYVDHPLVLDSAIRLIDVLIHLEEYYDAERYARICYECLSRPMNFNVVFHCLTNWVVGNHRTESELVANAAESLGKVVLKIFLNNEPETVDLLEVEDLFRKSNLIKEKLYGINHRGTVGGLQLLANVLWLRKGHHNGERLRLLETILATYISMSEGDSDNIAIANYNLSEYHKCIAEDTLPLGNARTEELRIAESYHREMMRINPRVNETAEIQYVGTLTGPDSDNDDAKRVIQKVTDEWENSGNPPLPNITWMKGQEGSYSRL